MYSTNIYWVLLHVKRILCTEHTMVSMTKKTLHLLMKAAGSKWAHNEKQRRWGTTVQWHHPECVICVEVRAQILFQRGAYWLRWDVVRGQPSALQLCLSCWELPYPRPPLSDGWLWPVREHGGGKEVGPFQPKCDNSNGQYSFQSILPGGLRLSPACTVIWFLPLVIMLPSLVFPWSWSLINKLHTNRHLNICF